MKILFVTMDPFENNTSAAIQNRGILKGLSSLAHDVDIMTLKPDPSSTSYDDTLGSVKMLVTDLYYISIDKKYSMLRAKKQRPGEIGHFTIANFLAPVFISMRDFIKYIYDQVSIFDAQTVNLRGVSKMDIDYSKYDVIISSSDPKSSHLIARKIFQKNRHCRAAWIQYWGDPMLHDIGRKRGWRDKIVKYHEARLIEEADRVVYASPLTLEKQKKTFYKFAKKMEYANQVYSHKANEKAIKHKSKKGLIKVGYIGAYQSGKRDIIPLYNSAKAGNYLLNICGASDIKLKSTDYITIHGAVPYRQALEIEYNSDILVCICNKIGTQIPAKIYYCAGYNKPIIIILDGEYKNKLRNYFMKFNRYILCNNKEGSIITAIEKAKNILNKFEFTIDKQLTPTYMARKVLGV